METVLVAICKTNRVVYDAIDHYRFARVVERRDGQVAVACPRYPQGIYCGVQLPTSAGAIPVLAARDLIRQ